ncbi:MAG TPA: phospho-N-acetylmuramoyl-pentapeptide-transferase [Mycobacteriales bacterium]|nr:phospho-N-acetylmuramoyl-pentapeptide-transferase [Mycobacteriales bacterium]
MKDVLIAAMAGLLASILCTPVVIKYFRRYGLGQEIRDDGPESHLAKRGTPTMGGVVIIVATLAGYSAAHLFMLGDPKQSPTASGMLILYLMTGLGLVGFVDDFTKIRRQRSLGLNKTAKLVGQLVVGISFAYLALRFRNGSDLTPVSTHLSFVRDIGEINFFTVGFLIFAYLFISGFSNATNFTDGLDGLLAGSAVMVFGVYVVISFYEFRNTCGSTTGAGCYQVRDPLDIALIAAAAAGACAGFLWWNAHPAMIMMGDTGSLAIGGLVSAIAMMTKTELLLIVLGGLWAVQMLSVVLQIGSFRLFHRRVVRMAPVHHHFELGGWSETTVLIRFWIVSGFGAALGLGLFYAEFLSHGPPG